ncbi:hypothetical protein [Iningainema tapete]|nr:hypothetical protein [Iningainema tapete]
MNHFISFETALQFLTITYAVSIMLILLGSQVCLQIIEIIEAGK